MAIFDGPESLPRVVACNEQAQLQGVAVGSTKTQAGQCTGILLRKRDPKQEEATQTALVDSALAFSPRIESTAQGIVTLDVEGTERIFGPPQKLTRALAEHTARIGLDVSVSAAANPDTALLAAKGFGGTTVIPAGSEATFLAHLPIDVLPLTPAQTEILDSWGIRRFKDLALLPPVPLVERLGQSGLHLQRLARGEISRTLVPVDPPLQFVETLELEDSVADLESLAFVLNRLLEQISLRLLSRSLATDELRLKLDLEVFEDRELGTRPVKRSQQTFERTLRLPVSIQDTKVLLKLLQLDLVQHGPGGAVKAVTLEARPARQRHTQGGLFAALAPEPERLEVTLARIRGVVGDTDSQGRGRVGAAEVLNSNRPDDFRMNAFVAHDLKDTPGQSTRPSVVMSMFRPHLAARVRCESGRPVHVSFAEVNSPVICAAGPWMTSGNWWKKDEEWRREEWDVALQLSDGVGLYRIFRELRQNTWFVEGLYD